MRYISSLLATLFLLILTSGCAAQQIPPVPVTTAPPVTSIAYSQLNAGTNNGGPTTALNYKDLPSTGNFCYFVQMLDGTGVSAASNTVCVTTTSSLPHVQLTWNQGSGYTCINTCTFVVSRAAAITTPVGIPTMSNPTNIASNSVPEFNLLTLKAISSR